MCVNIRETGVGGGCEGGLDGADSATRSRIRAARARAAPRRLTAAPPLCPRPFCVRAGALAFARCCCGAGGAHAPPLRS
eukprot:3611625-Prymnesium_polylepis.1